ncbi:late embryogenesis abundant protein 1-like [Asparagus officinalis]|uniref:late embryogenesis abundant protein 1-like n=1 Tax=Asparagus officinalis TaxID=4686 RepID=UPI00098E4AE9|nr:late embryogenesis abundant protein 1-like [Asparagus officinalis]
MADQSNMSFQAGQAAGQAQVKKDDLVSKASQAAQETKEQAAGYIQQTGEQIKNMAQGASDAVKNAAGMAADNSGSAATTTRTTVSKH